MKQISADFIIVGAGSAGCVLADRLSQCGRFNVLVLEAGGSDSHFWIKMPVGYGKTFGDERLNWNYTAQPDSGLNGRAIYWPRGRVVGGCSSINAMAYMRGLPGDFDDWQASGATGWNWSNVKTAYERLEQHDECMADGRRIRRGLGPVRVSDLSDQMHPFSKHFLKAATELGWPIVKNLNEVQSGVGYYRSTVRDGRRWSAADAFLRPALMRPNLELLTGAQIDRVEIVHGRAVGVAGHHNGQPFRASANAQVILSAGAINSPHLLQLSGVGPGAQLQAHGVDVQRDLPQVGGGLQDHLAITHHFEARQPTLNPVFGRAMARTLSGMKYVLTRRGPMAVPVNQVGGYVSSACGGAVDTQLFCNPISYRSTGKDVIMPEAASGFILSAQPCRPSSRGEVRLASPRPTAPPEIHANSLSNERDCDAAIRTGRLLQKFAKAPALRRVSGGSKGPDLATMDDAALLEDFRERASTVFHPCGTCRMGRDAQDSVLDARLRVHGVAGLRVVDAAAFPNITSGNTNAPVMMLALRAADMILEDARLGEKGQKCA